MKFKEQYKKWGIIGLFEMMGVVVDATKLGGKRLWQALAIL